MKKNIFFIFLSGLIDVLIIVFASFFSLAMERPETMFGLWRFYLLSNVLNAMTLLLLYSVMRLYLARSEYAGFPEGLRILFSCILITVLHGLEMYYALKLRPILTAGYLVIFLFVLFSFSLINHFFGRFQIAFKLYRHRMFSHDSIPVMIVGAGKAGSMLLDELLNSDKLNVTVKCFIDDDKAKEGRYIHGIKIAGTREDIPALAQRFAVQEIYIAMPSCGGKTVKEISDICAKTGCKVKTLPGMYQLVNGEFSLHDLREISVEDLLARPPVQMDMSDVLDYVSDRVIMVTGGGGSIGSELCRQIASHNPRRLIIVDIYENNAYDIQQELLRKYPRLDLVVLIASVRDEKRMDRIFATYHPQIVYHAAAHKHVPLMETSPNEAIKNNVFGTLKTARLADKYGVKRFVMISTDKAVNPTNVMGATKRLCEMIIQAYNKRSKTEYVAVRFGNVLGSNGSVIPLFKKQIAQGGPVLVTHPDIIRYFMTIPEAVALVIQAGAYAKGGEIFVLDMGEPVKILSLAENLIRLSGFEPYKEIPIQFVGLRPGEKLYEEMLMDEEGLQDTENKLIHIGKPISFDEENFFLKLEALERSMQSEPKNTRRLIKELVPTYQGNAELDNL